MNIQNPGNFLKLVDSWAFQASFERAQVRPTRDNAEILLGYPLVNLRIIAELLIFIAQTGMNLSQAYSLLRAQYSYKSTIDGFEVRDYKERRKGEVLFEIFADYKAIFQSYLAWLDDVFGSTTDRLFPLVRTMGAAASTPPDFKRFKDDICTPMGIPFVGPQALRKTRINWILRETRNTELTAELDQHTRQTLLRVYEHAKSMTVKLALTSRPRASSNPAPPVAPPVFARNRALTVRKPKACPSAFLRPVQALPAEQQECRCQQPDQGGRQQGLKKAEARGKQIDGDQIGRIGQQGKQPE